MKKGMWVCEPILLLIVIGSLFVCVVSAEAIIIDTEKGESDSVPQSVTKIVFDCAFHQKTLQH